MLISLIYEEKSMDDKTFIQQNIKFGLFCLVCIGLLSACAGSINSIGGPNQDSSASTDIQETQDVIPGDEVVKSPPDETDSPDDDVVSPPDGDSLPAVAGFDWDPKPEDNDLEKGEAFLNQSDILIMESYPPQFALSISGALPTPCHKLRVEVNEPDEENEIHILMYSVIDTSEICVQVLESFDANVQLGTPPPGTYQVILNGEELGEIGYE